jgi:hypothetical protein
MQAEGFDLMWRELLKSLAWDGEIDLAPPATTSQITETEKALQVALPDDLKQLLLETREVRGSFGVALVMPADSIVTENLGYRSEPEFKELYMPFDPLLIFGEDRNGDMYAFRILDGKIRDSAVYHWNHEDDSRTWFASNLQQYFEKRLAKE